MDAAEEPEFHRRNEGSLVSVECLHCVLASVSQLSCTTAPCRRLGPELFLGPAGSTGFAVPAQRDSISPTEHCRGAPSGTRDYAIWKVCEINQLSIQLQNKSTGHPETRRLAIGVKSKKRKTNPEVCFSKIAQFVTQKRNTATGEVTKQREEINI